MSAIGIGRQRLTIGAHADHKTSDFFFPRVQSLETRDLPWENRSKRLYSYGELAFYAGACLLIASLTLSFI